MAVHYTVDINDTFTPVIAAICTVKSALIINAVTEPLKQTLLLYMNNAPRSALSAGLSVTEWLDNRIYNVEFLCSYRRFISHLGRCFTTRHASIKSALRIG